MEEKCTWQAIEKRTNVVPLCCCKRIVTEHTCEVGLTEDIEFELILTRASTFVSPSDISSWQICQAHRSRLRTGWKREANRCRVQAVMSSHGGRKRIGEWRIRNILRYLGVFLPVDSGM